MKKTISNNINLDISEKSRYTINGNPDKYIELNPNDVGIIARMGTIIPTLNGLVDKYENLMTTSGDEENATAEESIIKFSKNFIEIDSQMREAINTLFDYDVCSVCISGGSTLDIKNGAFVFSIVINTLIQMYEDTITAEMQKMVDKIKKHTDKYTPQDHKKRG